MYLRAQAGIPIAKAMADMKWLLNSKGIKEKACLFSNPWADFTQVFDPLE